MSLNLLSYPQAVYKQTTAPTGISAGALWWDTDDLLLYYYTGSAWVQISSASDATGWESPVSQIILEILRLSAEGTLTAPDYDSMFVDYFSDADGQDDTIDTGNTTTDFFGDNYTNSGSVTDAHGQTLGSGSSVTNYYGMKITTKKEIVGFKVTKNTNCDATHCYLKNSGGTLITSVAFSGDVAIFSDTLANATTYRLECGKGGASYTRRYLGSSSYPYNDTNLDWVSGSNNGSDDSGDVYCIENIISLDDLGAAELIQTNAQALSFAPAYILVHSKDITHNGTSGATFDVSFDGGSTWDSEGNALDTKIAVTDGSSKNMIIQINLTGTGAGNYSTIKDYAVVLWSS